MTRELNMDVLYDVKTSRNKITVTPALMIVKVKAGLTKEESDRVVNLAKKIWAGMDGIELQTFRGSFRDVHPDQPIRILMKNASQQICYPFQEYSN